MSWIIVGVIGIVIVAICVSHPKLFGTIILAGILFAAYQFSDQYSELPYAIGGLIIFILILYALLKALGLIGHSINNLAHSIEKSSENKKSAAQAQEAAVHAQIQHEQEEKAEEIRKQNSRYLNQMLDSMSGAGHTSLNQIREQLPAYTQPNIPYENGETFDRIVTDYVNGKEHTVFSSDMRWAEPYVRKIVDYRGPKTVANLIHEVDGPLRHHIHFTADENLLRNALDFYTQRRGMDIPPVLKKTTINDTTWYEPTLYGYKLYGNGNGTDEYSEAREDIINFDDL